MILENPCNENWSFNTLYGSSVTARMIARASCPKLRSFQYPLRVECYCKKPKKQQGKPFDSSFNTLYGSSVTASARWFWGWKTLNIVSIPSTGRVLLQAMIADLLATITAMFQYPLRVECYCKHQERLLMKVGQRKFQYPLRVECYCKSLGIT